MSARRLSEHRVDEGDDPLSMLDADAEEWSAVVGASKGKTSGDDTEKPIAPENKHLSSTIKLTAGNDSNLHSPLSGPVSAGSTTFSPSDGLRVGQIATTPPISDELMKQVLTGKKPERNSSSAKREIAVSLDSVASEDGPTDSEAPADMTLRSPNKRASTAWVHNTELEGEQVVMTTQNVLYFSPISKKGIKGSLEVTNFKMRFKPVDQNDSSKVPTGLFTIPLMTIDRMTLKKLDAASSSSLPQHQHPFQPTEIYMLCKDARHLRFEVHDRALGMDKLEMLFTAFVYPNNPKHLLHLITNILTSRKKAAPVGMYTEPTESGNALG